MSALCLPVDGHASITLTSVIGDGMVLQVGQPVPIWGLAGAGARVTVSVAGQTHVTKADQLGRWEIKLKPLKAGKVGQLSIQEGKDKAHIIKDLLAGEVWLCSGQSNMEWPLRLTQKGKATLASKRINDPQLRLFRMPHQTSRKPISLSRKGRWVKSTATSARDFSSICYYFGQMLRKQLKRPVGLIQSTWGGTQIAAWMPASALKHPAYKNLLRRQYRWESLIRPARVRYRARMRKRWEKRVYLAQKADKDPPKKPRWMSYKLRPAWHANSPSALYNGMISPLMPFALRGFLWYQGESDAYRAYLYRTSFPLMIESWRRDWRKQLPFLFVQIAPYRYRRMRMHQSLYNELCEAQSMTLDKTFNTGMVVTNDLGNLKDIHPRRKRAVAARLMRHALTLAYKRKGIPTGPLFQEAVRQGNKMLVRFRNVHKKLVVRGKRLQYFEVAGADKRYVPAQAKVKGKEVLVWSKQVPQPVAVRFAWREDAIHHLFDQAGLPVSSFRSDQWPRLSQKRR